jgi:all-trans-retinol 13,14-reductase
LLLDNQSGVNYDAIVIGSGISGLTISIILAKEGKKVALFERDKDIAPLIRPYQREGCGCSPGLHISGWMAQGDVIDSFFRYLNVTDGVEKGLVEKGLGRVIIGTNQYHIPNGFDNVEKSFLSYFPESAEAIHQYIRQVRKVNEESFYLNHQMAPNIKNIHELMSSDSYTLQEYLKQYNAPQELIDILGTLNNILVGSTADEIPFKVHALVLGGFYRSLGFFTIHGINRFLANSKRELTRLGVDLYLNSEIAEILIDNKQAMGVKTVKGDSYFASTVIASFNPKLLNSQVKCDMLRPIYRRRLEEAENTFGFYVAFYKIKLDQEFEDFTYFDRNSGTILGVTFNHSGDNKVLSAMLADYDQGFPINSEGKKGRAEEKLRLLENLLYDKMPILKGKAVLIDYLKPWSFERYTKTVNGSAYGIKQTYNTMGFQHRTPIHGLYLVGQAIYPGFLGSMISSFALACEFFDVNEFWPRVINQ